MFLSESFYIFVLHLSITFKVYYDVKVGLGELTGAMPLPPPPTFALSQPPHSLLPPIPNIQNSPM